MTGLERASGSGRSKRLSGLRCARRSGERTSIGRPHTPPQPGPSGQPGVYRTAELFSFHDMPAQPKCVLSGPISCAPRYAFRWTSGVVVTAQLGVVADHDEWELLCPRSVMSSSTWMYHIGKKNILVHWSGEKVPGWGRCGVGVGHHSTVRTPEPDRAKNTLIVTW